MSTEVKKAAPPPSRNNGILHTFSDGSILRKMPARDLIKIPIWNGNRILDVEHRQSILSSLKNGVRDLDGKPFHIVSYPKEENETIITYSVVDGQHRLSIIRESDNLEFDLLVVEKKCSSEREVVDYFKVLNTTKAIEWREDPKVVTQSFISALEDAFNPPKEKDKKIRQKATHRPYLYVESLRDELQKRKIGMDGKKPQEFIAYAQRKNRELLASLGEGKDKTEKRAIEMGFALALDPKFRWLDGF